MRRTSRYWRLVGQANACPGSLLHSLADVLDHHQLVPARVDDLYGDALLVTGHERLAFRPRKVVPQRVGVGCFQGTLEVLPSARTWEEHLLRTEAELVVVAVEHPTRDVVALQLDVLHGDRVE